MTGLHRLISGQTSRRITTMPSRSNERDERGQVLVIVAMSLIVLIALVGLVIDGGLAWGHQRNTQNVADATAKAGATVLAERLAGATRNDGDVLSAVDATADANGLDDLVAYYTDDQGRLLTPAGGLAANTGTAAVVGGGSIPTGSYGVMSEGELTFDTLLARVIGVDEFTTVANATAISGYRNSTCPASAGCGVMPVTLPITILGCDGSNNPAPAEPEQQWELGVFYTLPLCKNGPGNVGWLDWTPTAGGTSELEDAINEMSNPAMTWPGWYYITSTGNVNSDAIEDAINGYLGEVVSIPIFDVTCDAEPTGPGGTDCPPGHEGGNGSNQWYHLVGMASLRLCGPGITECGTFTQGAYISGMNPQCDTGNGGTSCLAGLFEAIVEEGEVSANPPPNAAIAQVGIQLIE
jgi:Flp pilus assembly protein TadG